MSDIFETSRQEWQDDLCQLSTRSSHKVVVKAGRYIQPEEPQLVAEAILEVVKEGNNYERMRMLSPE